MARRMLLCGVAAVNARKTARGHEEDAPAPRTTSHVRRTTSGLRPATFLPPVSGDELAAALGLRGWRSVGSTTHEHRLELHGCGEVTVPREAILDPEVLIAVLEAAQLTPLALVELLDRLPVDAAPPRPPR